MFEDFLIYDCCFYHLYRILFGSLELCSQCGFFELCSASGLEPSAKKLTSSPGTTTFFRAFYNIIIPIIFACSSDRLESPVSFFLNDKIFLFF